MLVDLGDDHEQIMNLLLAADNDIHDRPDEDTEAVNAIVISAREQVLREMPLGGGSEASTNDVDGEAAYEIVQDAISYAKANLDSSRMMHLNEVLNMFEIYSLKKKLEVNPWEKLGTEKAEMARCSRCNEWVTYILNEQGTKISSDHFCRNGE